MYYSITQVRIVRDLNSIKDMGVKCILIVFTISQRTSVPLVNQASCNQCLAISYTKLDVTQTLSFLYSKNLYSKIIAFKLTNSTITKYTRTHKLNTHITQKEQSATTRDFQQCGILTSVD